VSRLSAGVIAISAGSSHTCAILDSGAVKCWGNNENGQLGDGATTDRKAPAQVSGLSSGVVSLSAGGNHTCAILDSGAVKCWGSNRYGQLGHTAYLQKDKEEVSAIDKLLGTTKFLYWPNPKGVSGLTSGVVSISSGSCHTCALMDTGGVKCWGWNSSGQLGEGTTINRTTPSQVSGLSRGVMSMSAGYRHTCALLDTGVAKCWGSNNYAQLGQGIGKSPSSYEDIDFVKNSAYLSTYPVRVKGFQ
jgi:alpha-tubulin suppressor-like RCC1 family protein